MPKITRKTRWTAQELKEHYSKPLSRFYSPKQRQQHNLFAKYVNEGKLTNKAVIRDNAVYLGKGVRTQQVITGLHPNAAGRVQTSKLGKVNVKASDAANTIPASEIKFKEYYRPGDFPQSGGQHNLFAFKPEVNKMVVRYQDRKGKVGWYDYDIPGNPRQAQHNMMYAIDSRVPIPKNADEETIGLNKMWQKNYRDTYSAGRKILFANKEEEKAAFKIMSTANLWDEDYVKPSNFAIKSSDAWNKRVEDAVKAVSKKKNIAENTRKYRAELKEKYGE